MNLFQKECMITRDIQEPKSVGGYSLNALSIMFLGDLIALGMMELLKVFFGLQLSVGIENLYYLFATSLPIFIYFLIQNKDDCRSFYSLGLSLRKIIPHYIGGHMIGFIMFSSVVAIAYLMKGVRFVGVEASDFILLFLFFIAFMIQGFEEEFICRGYMMFGISRKKSMCFAILFNSFFFAILHLGNDGIGLLALINLFLAGVSFSLMAVYFDDIWVASGAHSMWNYAQGNIYGLLVSGIPCGPSFLRFEAIGGSIITGGLFGLEGGLATTIVELLFIVILCLIYATKERCHKFHKMI